MSLITPPQKILLASSSPRRYELLQMAGLKFEVVKIEVNEVYPASLKPEEVPVYLAKLKASSVALPDQNTVVIGADTVVILEDKIFGKPQSKGEAIEMLSALSNKTHKVITGVCLSSLNKQVYFAEETLVTFTKLTAEQIEFYIDNFKPFDKAGAYACQEWIGLIGIKRLEGDYFNVVGLPVWRTYEELLKF